MKTPPIKRLVFFLPVIAGVVLVTFLVNSKKSPNRPEMKEHSRPVKIIEVNRMAIIPRVVGYGYVQPSETWEAIPEVSGRVVEIHPELKRGTFVGKGELLLKIDPESYGLAQSRGEANLMNLDAQLLKLEQERVNTEKLLEIEQQTLRLVQKEVERQRTLFKKSGISASALEKEEKTLLGQQATINNLKNILKLIPARKKELLAKKESDVSSLTELKLDVEKTVIRAPFDCRVSEVNIEKDQLASTGQTLLKVISIDEVEVPVQLSPNDFINLLSAPEGNKPVSTEDFTMDRLREIVGLKAEVRLPLFSREAVWEAEFRRTSDSIDLETGAVTVFVAVKRPYEMVIPGVRPPLIPNMYCEVELIGQPRSDRYVVPLHSVHEGYLYLMNEKSRLERRKVEVEMIIGNMAIISEGLDGKVSVITTDLVPAIDGQLLDSVVDQRMMENIAEIGIEG